MSFFPSERQIRTAAANPAQAGATGFAENIEAQWQRGRFLDRSTGNLGALYDVWDEYIDEIGSTNPEVAAQVGNPVAFEATPGVAAFSSIERAEAFAFERIEQAGLAPLTSQKLRQRAIAKAEQVKREAEDVASRATSLGTLGGFLGSAGAVVTDPPVLGSMFLGAGVASGIMRTALVESAIAGLVEIAIQPFIAASRAELGTELTFEEAVENVLFAAGGGALFGGGLKAAGAGTRAIREALSSSAAQIDAGGVPDIPEVNDAVVYTQRAQAMSGETPFNRAEYEAQSEHVKRYDEAMAAGREGRAANIAPENPVPVRPEVLDEVPTARTQDVPGGEAVAGLGRSIQEASTEAERSRSALRRPAEALRVEAQTGGTVDVRQRLDELQGLLQKPGQRPKPERLAQFLKRTGGLRDEGGELRQGLGLAPRDRPGLINDRSGRSLDDAALAAQEAGFFPGRDLEAGDRITPDDLLEATQDDLSGRARFRDIDEQDVALVREIEDLERALDEAGVSVQDIPPGGLGQVLNDTTRAQDRLSGATATQDRARARMDALDEPKVRALNETVETQVRSTIEDLDEDVFFDLEDDGPPVSARQMLDEIDEEQAAVKELNDCIVGGAA